MNYYLITVFYLRDKKYFKHGICEGRIIKCLGIRKTDKKWWGAVCCGRRVQARRDSLKQGCERGGGCVCAAVPQVRWAPTASAAPGSLLEMQIPGLHLLNQILWMRPSHLWSHRPFRNSAARYSLRTKDLYCPFLKFEIVMKQGIILRGTCWVLEQNESLSRKLFPFPISHAFW